MKLHTVLQFETMSCRIDRLLGDGSNGFVYQGTRLSEKEDIPSLLIRELFPCHPQGRIFRSQDNHIRVEPDAEDFYTRHRESFLTAGEIHARALADHPELSGGPMDFFQCNGTWYALVPLPRMISLGEALNHSQESLLCHTRRILGLLDALESYHKCGYLHLRIDPDHILLTEDPDPQQVYLLQVDTSPPFSSQDLWESPFRPGYTSPEMEGEISDLADFSSDLYSVAAVFFHMLMGRPLSLEELLYSGTPSVRDSLCLRTEPYPVRQMVIRILKKGLHILPTKRYRSVGQMRRVFLELLERIQHKGVTHWSVWENGRKTAEEWSCSLSDPLGMDPLVDAWLRQGKRYSTSAPALIRVRPECSGNPEGHVLCRQILSTLRLEDGDSTLSALEHLLQKKADTGPILLVLDGLEQLPSHSLALVSELEYLSRMKGLKILDGTGKPMETTHFPCSG